LRHWSSPEWSPHRPAPVPSHDNIRPCAVRHPDIDTDGNPDRHDVPDGGSHRYNEPDRLSDTGDTDTDTDRHVLPTVTPTATSASTVPSSSAPATVGHR
jgi:hypothetical protein